MNSVKKVCFINDSDCILNEYKRFFRDLNFNVELQSKHDNEIENETDETLDLILMDLDDLSSTGIDVLKKIKSKPELNSVPVIVFSSIYGKKFLSDLYNNGASDYIQKPFIKEEFLMSVQAQLEKSLYKKLLHC